MYSIHANVVINLNHMSIIHTTCTLYSCTNVQCTCIHVHVVPLVSVVLSSSSMLPPSSWIATQYKHKINV